MKKPVTIWATCLLLMGWGLYVTSTAFQYDYSRYEFFTWAFAASGPIALIGGFGLVLNRQWSQFFVYANAILLVATWSYATWQAVRDNPPSESILETVISFVPGSLLVLFCVTTSLVVFRYFRRLPPSS